MKKSVGYSINGNVVTLTKAFAKKAYTPGTKEFREFSAIIKAYPNLVVTMRTATITADKNTHEGLTIEWMTTYIKTYKDETAVAEFEEVKKFYKMMNGYYGKVKAWFLKKYPNYQELIENDDVDSSTQDEENTTAPADLRKLA